MSTVAETTDKTFDADVLKVDIPVLVLFCAGSSVGCRSVQDWLEVLIGELAGFLKIVSVDVDANNYVTTGYEVVTVPTLILFRNGVERLRMEKVASLEALRGRILPCLDVDGQLPQTQARHIHVAVRE